VYTTVGWEEHRGNIAAFRDGQWIQQTAHWRKGGIDRLVGETITANSKFIFFATGKSGPGDHDGAVMGTSLARRDRADIANRALERRVSVGVRIRGVAATDERVFVACADDRIRVFDVELRTVTNWFAPSPGELAVDAAGRLWVCDVAANVVRCFDATGRGPLQTVSFPPGVVPVDVAISPDQRLLVADGGTSRQVRIYQGLDSTPRLESVFGEVGGVFGGPVPGRVGPRRFVAPIGVGADARGHLIVASGPFASTHGGTTMIECYDREGCRTWQLLCTEWLDTVDLDRTRDGTVAFGSRFRYELDLTTFPRLRWTPVAMTVHPDRYPEDPRLRSPAIGGVWFRRLGGRSYLFMPDMPGDNLYGFRFDPPRAGEIAVWCTHIGVRELWCDLNGNGRKDEGESTTNVVSTARGWFVEPNGTVWQAAQHRGVARYPLAEVLSNGVPVYREEHRTITPPPPPLKEIRRLVYDRANDVMYLGGASAEAPAGHWKPMGPVLARYDRWSQSPVLAWAVVLPHERGGSRHESFEPFDFAVEGDFVFVVYAGRLPSRRWPPGTVLVLRRSEGRAVGYMCPDGTRVGAVPMDALQDIVHSINVLRRSNGEYLVVIEDDGYSKNVVYRWKP
jgi:hypothetical protein